MLDHEQLDVYRVSLDFATWSYDHVKGLTGVDRHARDQLLRASQSIVLNTAEGCSRAAPTRDRARFLTIACGSARECGAIVDILGRRGLLSEEERRGGKRLLARIVSMLTRLAGESRRGIGEGSDG